MAVRRISGKRKASGRRGAVPLQMLQEIETDLHPEGLMLNWPLEDSEIGAGMSLC